MPTPQDIGILQRNPLAMQLLQQQHAQRSQQFQDAQGSILGQIAGGGGPMPNQLEAPLQFIVELLRALAQQQMPQQPGPAPNITPRHPGTGQLMFGPGFGP